MITKTGSILNGGLANIALGIGAAGALGYGKASNLSERQRDDLKSYYELAPDADLTKRNIGRSIVGGGITSLLGSLGLNLATKGKANVHLRRAVALGSGLAGAYYNSNKYSQGNANRLGNIL